MREIKFRIWSKQYKEMIPNIELCFLNPSRKIPDDGRVEYYLVHPIGWHKFKDKNSLIVGFEHFDDCEIMQHTGLQDKNGKEIYESDVVKVVSNFTNYVGRGTGEEYTDTVEVHNEESHAGIIKFKNGAFFIKFYEKNIPDYFLHEFKDNEIYDFTIEVIGNVYDSEATS